jgi:hypothetical protein
MSGDEGKTRRKQCNIYSSSIEAEQQLRTDKSVLMQRDIWFHPPQNTAKNEAISILAFLT